MCPTNTKRTKTSVYGPMVVDWVNSLRKILTRLRGTNFCPSSARFPPSLVRQPNCPNCTQMVRNIPKQKFRVQWGWSGAFIKKISMRLRGTNFCTSSARFPPRFVRQANCSNRTQMVWKTPKHEFRVQWSGLGAFVAKNPDVTAWHELVN